MRSTIAFALILAATAAIGQGLPPEELPGQPSPTPDVEAEAVVEDDAPAAIPARHVVLVGGINKDPEERQNKDRNVLRLYRLFEKASGDVHVLVDENSLVRDMRSVAAPALSSHANIKKTLADLAKTVDPSERLLFFFTGQANLVGDALRLNLAGPDVTHTELIEWLAPIPAHEMVIILDCPHAGLVVKPLCEGFPASRPGAFLVICSSRSDQPYATRFGDFFIPALSDPESDGDASGTISVLEAFRLACQRVDAMFRDQNLMKTETALLEDNGDGLPSQRPWRHQEEDTDGGRAARIFLMEGTL